MTSVVIVGSGLKSTAEALYLRDHVLEQLELANIDDDAERAAARRTIVVVGASYSGTELAVQLRALADERKGSVIAEVAALARLDLGDRCSSASVAKIRSRRRNYPPPAAYRANSR